VLESPCRRDTLRSHSSFKLITVPACDLSRFLSFRARATGLRHATTSNNTSPISVFLRSSFPRPGRHGGRCSHSHYASPHCQFVELRCNCRRQMMIRVSRRHHGTTFHSCWPLQMLTVAGAAAHDGGERCRCCRGFIARKRGECRPLTTSHRSLLASMSSRLKLRSSISAPMLSHHASAFPLPVGDDHARRQPRKWFHAAPDVALVTLSLHHRRHGPTVVAPRRASYRSPPHGRASRRRPITCRHRS